MLLPLPAALETGPHVRVRDFVKTHSLTVCDIPTCRAHSGDHNALWYTVRVCIDGDDGEAMAASGRYEV